MMMGCFDIGVRNFPNLDYSCLTNPPGFSYVTILGATVAAMFPDKIDRLVLDGVENPHLYYAGRYINISAVKER